MHCAIQHVQLLTNLLQWLSMSPPANAPGFTKRDQALASEQDADTVAPAIEKRNHLSQLNRTFANAWQLVYNAVMAEAPDTRVSASIVEKTLTRLTMKRTMSIADDMVSSPCVSSPPSVSGLLLHLGCFPGMMCNRIAASGPQMRSPIS